MAEYQAQPYILYIVEGRFMTNIMATLLTYKLHITISNNGVPRNHYLELVNTIKPCPCHKNRASCQRRSDGFDYWPKPHVIAK